MARGCGETTGAQVMIAKRGDVWLALPAETRGAADLANARPFAIVSPLELNEHLRTVIAAPVAEPGTPAPFRLPLRLKGKRVELLLDQLYTLDKGVLIHRVAVLSPATLNGALLTLQEAFAP
jgi:mRNA interferase MazF